MNAALDTGWYELEGVEPQEYALDPQGCVNEYMIAPYLYLDQPDSLRLDSIYSPPAQCYDSTDAFIEIFASGGNTISYSIDSLTFQASNEFYNVAPDSLYFPTITDENNCPAYYAPDFKPNNLVASDYTVDQDTLIIVEPKPMFINFITKDLTCNEYFDGEIEAVITGGNADPTVFLDGYSYEWSFDSTSAVNGQYGYFIDTLIRPDIDSLWAGTYSVYVEDYKGCYATA